MMRSFIYIGLLLTGGFVAFQSVLSQTTTLGPHRPVLRSDSADAPKALAKVKSGNFAGYEAGLVSDTGIVEAIPYLKQKFPTVKDEMEKAKLAQSLVKLGDRDPLYWTYLTGLAEKALTSDAPEFFIYDEQGKEQQGPSPAWTAWATRNNASLSDAYNNSVWYFPGAISLLADTMDLRAIPYLRRGLLSPNYQVENSAAAALAEFNDTASIPLLIDACTRAPKQVATRIARSLVFFDDPSAQRTVDTYVPKDSAKILRDFKEKEKMRITGRSAP